MGNTTITIVQVSPLEFQEMLMGAIEKAVENVTEKQKFILHEDRFLTGEEAKKRLGVSQNTFKSYVEEGKIKAYHFKGVGRPKYKLSEIMAI